MSPSEDETGAEGAAPKGLGGGDSFTLRIGVFGCSTGGGIGSVLLGCLTHIPLLNVHLSLFSRFLLMMFYLSL